MRDPWHPIQRAREAPGGVTSRRRSTSQDISPLTVALRDYHADQTETLVCPSGYSVYANGDGFAIEFPSPNGLGAPYGICLPDGTTAIDYYSTFTNKRDCSCHDPTRANDPSATEMDNRFNGYFPPSSGSIGFLNLPCPDCEGEFSDGSEKYKIYGTPKGHTETNVRGDRLP